MLGHFVLRLGYLQLLTAMMSTQLYTSSTGTTLMAVGFGYGANMLTKYLAEVGEDTPLTATTCFDNPFDLTVSPPDQHSLTHGFIEILQSNKVCCLFHIL